MAVLTELWMGAERRGWRAACHPDHPARSRAFAMVNIEQTLKQDWPEGRSVGAAAREFCRSLGVSGQFPVLREMLEILLVQANDQAADRAAILGAFDKAAPEAAQKARQESFQRCNSNSL